MRVALALREFSWGRRLRRILRLQRMLVLLSKAVAKMLVAVSGENLQLFGRLSVPIQDHLRSVWFGKLTNLLLNRCTVTVPS